MKVQYALMKRREPYSLYAFIIAVLVHLVLMLVIIILDQLKPVPPKPDKMPQEERFRLSLKERPEAPKEALVKNDIPKKAQTRAIPHGEQLIKPAPLFPTPRVSKPLPPVKRPVAEPLPAVTPEKGFERPAPKTAATTERQPQPKKESGLYDILSRPDPSIQDQPTDTIKVSESIQRLYGDKFSELSAGEQKYILDNQEIMRRITQQVLNRYGQSRIPDNIRANSTNMIEFYLHPDGSISDIRFLEKSSLSILDDTTKEVIELAYAKYPRPQQKTLIRYRVWYNLAGY